MLSLAHTITSLPFGVYLQDPVIIFVTAFIFHLFADTILHWNIYPDHFKKFPFGLVAIDISVGLIGAYLLVGPELLSLSILTAIAGSNAPDVLDGVWRVFLNDKQRNSLKALQPFFSFHDKIQHETLNPIKGLIPQAIVIVLAIYLIV